MASIKWVNMMFTFVDTVIEHEKNNKAKPHLAGFVFGLIVGGLISSVIVLALWPVALFEDKINYFIFPDKFMQGFFADYLQQNDK